jgi:uncharacterized surface protein with fasciclin (FAS1) repeats
MWLGAPQWGRSLAGAAGLLLAVAGCGTTDTARDDPPAAVSSPGEGEDLEPDVEPTASAPEDAGGEDLEVAGSEVSPDEAAGMTIAEVLAADERFSRFHDVVERTEATIGGLPTTWLGLWDSEAHLFGEDREGVTVFAPTDAAFEALDASILAVIEDPDTDNLLRRTLLGVHYVPRLYPSSDFEPGAHEPIRGGADAVELTVDPLAWGGHAVEQPDLRTANGYIHVISGVVIPDDLEAAAGER